MDEYSRVDSGSLHDAKEALSHFERRGQCDIAASRLRAGRWTSPPGAPDRVGVLEAVGPPLGRRNLGKFSP